MLENAFLVSVCWIWACICTVYANTVKPRFFKGDLCNNNAVMESRNLVSVSRPIIASLGLEGFRSRLGLEGCRPRDWILQRNSIAKFLQFTIYCLLYLQVRNNQNNSDNARSLKLHCNGHHTPVSTWWWLHERCSTVY